MAGLTNPNPMKSSVDERLIDSGTFGTRVGWALRPELRQAFSGPKMPREPIHVPFFDHGVSAREMAAQPSDPWFNHRNEPDYSEDFNFISAARIKALLSENIDENADHFVLFTTAGTVLGHDKTHVFAKCRRFGSFAGPTFRHHDEAFAKTGKPSTNKTINDGMFNGKVLKFILQPGKSGLHAMIVEQEGVISAVVYCKQRTLMAAQMEKLKLGEELEPEFGKSKGEATDAGEALAGKTAELGVKDGEASNAGDVLAGKVAGLDVKDGEETATADSKDGDDTSATVKAEEDGTSKTATEDNGKQPEADDVKATEPDASNAKGKEPETDKITKVRILQLRAEALAEDLANDELKNFIMPKDFF